MGSLVILFIIITYFIVLLFISYIVGRKSTNNDAFFRGSRKSPWWAVAIAMVGASISGVSFVSVPGWVGSTQFTYMQTVFGFFFGYIVIAKLLLPLYYKLNLTSIYTYLGDRFGKYSYKTGSSFFLISKIIGAAARLYIVALILQTLVFNDLGVPFSVTVAILLFTIWAYTFRSGIKTIVWTDSLQAIIMVFALVFMIVELMQTMGLNVSMLTKEMMQNDWSRMFVFDDWISKQHFVKQFFSGVFIAIVMTGLDQDMMQKNLSCKSLPEAQKNMYWYAGAFIPVNFLFLTLGFLILLFAANNGISLPTKGDEILTFMAMNHFAKVGLLMFTLGIISAAFSSADSALTALTTSFSVDILGMNTEVETKQSKRIRMGVHIGITLLFLIVILIFNKLNNSSIIDAIYVIVSYTYGPLLGMYSFGLFTKLKPAEKAVPFIAVLSPIFCFGLDYLTTNYLGYKFGYELLLMNGGLTFLGLLISAKYGNKNS